MSLRDTITSQQLLAVSLAVIMIVSMGGMAFIGGAGAQTGGTFDGPIEAQETVNDDLNIADEDGDVVLLGPSDEDGGVDNAEVLGDGSVDVTGTTDSLTGVALTPERVDGFVDVDAAPSDGADFLDEAVAGNLSVDAGEEAFPAIFADFDPQSDFSQIEVNANEVDGDRDYIVIAENESIEELTDQTADGPIAVAAVSNEDGTTGASADILVEGAGSFENAVDQLVDDGNEQPVENQYLENVLFTAVTSGQDDTISGVTLGEESTLEAGETFHSEKITLNPGADEVFFSNISAADAAAETGDSITVAAGAYEDLESGEVTLATEDLTVTGVNQASVSDRVDDGLGETVVDNETESTVSVPVNLNASGVTVDGFQIEGDVAINQTDASNVAISNTVVEQDGGTGIDAQSSADITNTAVISDDVLDLGDETDIGIEANDSDVTISDSLLIGHAVQINASEGTDVTPYFNNNLFDDPRSQSAVALDDEGDVVGDRVPGSVELADDDANDGNVIDISAANYNHDADAGQGDLTVETDEISLNGVAGAAIWDDTDITSATSVSVDQLTFYANLTSSGADDPTVDVTNVDIAGEAPAALDPAVLLSSTAVNVDQSTIDFADAGDVTIDTVTVSDAGTDALLITDEEVGDVAISTVDITGIDDGTGVDVPAADSVSVTGVTLDADDNDVDGIAVDGINTDNDVLYTIDNNELREIGDGTGIAVNNSADVNDGEEGFLEITNNEVYGGSEVTAVNYSLPETDGANLSGNTLIGEDVAGGEDSIGFLFHRVTDFGSAGIIAPSTDETITFEDNTISGHARVVQDSTPESQVSNADYSAIYGVIEVDGETLGNEFGTLVVGPGDDLYADAYGSTDEFSEESYLPGSVDEAVDLVEDGELDSAELEVQDPTGVTGPDTYVDETVTFGALDEITLTGANEDVTVESEFEINGDSSTLNNHNIADLTIVSAGDAITVSEGSENAQNVFDNLNIVAINGDGIVVEDDVSGDVNVLEVYNSDILVDQDGSGIVAAGSADDRYGFEVENNNIASEGLTSTGVGIDVEAIEKPGKDDLDVDFSVQGNTLTGFAVQVNLAEGNFDDLHGEDGVFDTVLSQNTYTEQVLVLNASTEENAVDDANVSDASNIYGDIGTATEDVDGVTTDIENVIVDAQSDEYDYVEALTIGDTGFSGDNITVQGNGALISGAVDFSGVGSSADSVEFTGFDVVVDDDFVTPDVEVDVTNTTAEAPFEYEIADVTSVSGLDATAVTVSNMNTDVDVTDTAVSYDIDIDVVDATTVSPVDLNGADPFDGDIAELLDLTANVTGVQVDNYEQLTLSDVTVAAGMDTEAPNRGGVVVDDAGDLTIVDSTIDVEGDGVAFDTAADGTVDIEQTTITAAEEVDPLAGDDLTELDRVGSGVGTSGVAGAAATVELFEADVTSVDDDGFNVTDASGAYTLNSTDIASQSAVGVNASVVGGALNITEGTSVTAVENATNVYSAGADELVIQDSSFEGETALFLGAGVAQDTFTDKEGDNALVGNVFLGNADAEDAFDVYVTDNASFDGTVDVSLNYLGDDRGPFSSDAAGVYADGDQDSFIYDPFLTTADTGAVDDATDTTEFGHDVHLTGNDITTVAFPAQVEDGLTIGDAFDDGLQGAIYELEDGEFTSVDDFDREVEAFDAFVVQNTDETVPALVAYDSDEQNTNIATNEFEEGLNFVPATQAGNVSDALFPGGDTDFVQAPFNLGGNLYGDDRSTADFTNPSDAGFGANFQSGDLEDAVVHPHAGYFVIVNEDSNDGLTVSEQITKPATVTTDDVDDRTEYQGSIGAGSGTSTQAVA